MFHIGVVQEHIDCFHIIEVHITHSQDMPERSCRRNLHFWKVAKDPQKMCHGTLSHTESSESLILKALWKRSPVELYLLASRDPAGFCMTEYVRWPPATSAPTVAPLPVQMFSPIKARASYMFHLIPSRNAGSFHKFLAELCCNPCIPLQPDAECLPFCFVWYAPHF